MQKQSLSFALFLPPPSATLISTRKKVPPIKTVIYLDVLLLTNFALTLLFLLAAGLLAGVECRAGRLLLGGAAGAASSLALLAPEVPDTAALLYKVSTAALTVAAAYGWPGEQMLCPACGVVLRGKSAAGGGVAPARGPDQQRLHLPAPLAGGHCWRARAGWCWLCRGCSAFWAGAAGRYSPPGSPWQTQHWMSGPSATPAFRCRSRFRAGRWCWCGSVPCRAACRPPWVLIWSSTLPGPLPARPGAGGAPCSLHHRGRALYPAGRPGQPVLHRLPPPGRAGPSTSMPPSPTSPRRLMGGMCWWGAKPSAAWRMGRLHFHTTSPCFRHWRRSSLPNR